ncbi:MAG: hypothetical protein M0R22_00490 [Dehalococcoidia bacterium]|jgi:hypothetical protein|nr:hypothetical protein [Dehalococcoidia bacterium]
MPDEISRVPTSPETPIPRAAAAASKLPCLEVWIDDPPSVVKDPAYWALMREHGVMTAALMVDTTKPGLDSVYKPRDLAIILPLALDADISLVATDWPEPDMDKIDRACEILDHEILPFGFTALEGDAEGMWKEQHCRGFASLDGAAAYLVGRRRELAAKHDIALQGTTHTGHKEASKHAFLARLLDRMYYQLYSTESDWEGKKVAFSGPRGPGRLQEEFLEDVLEDIPELAKGIVQLGAGLAGYDQKWPGHEVEEALELAVAPLCSPLNDAGVRVMAIRMWSSKWLFGIRSDTPTQRRVLAWLKKTWGATRA